jgi:hypothetical protein
VSRTIRGKKKGHHPVKDDGPVVSLRHSLVYFFIVLIIQTVDTVPTIEPLAITKPTPTEPSNPSTVVRVESQASLVVLFCRLLPCVESCEVATEVTNILCCLVVVNKAQYVLMYRNGSERREKINVRAYAAHHGSTPRTPRKRENYSISKRSPVSGLERLRPHRVRLRGDTRPHAPLRHHPLRTPVAPIDRGRGTPSTAPC